MLEQLQMQLLFLYKKTGATGAGAGEIYSSWWKSLEKIDVFFFVLAGEAGIWTF